MPLQLNECKPRPGSFPQPRPPSGDTRFPEKGPIPGLLGEEPCPGCSGHFPLPYLGQLVYSQVKCLSSLK